MTTHDQLRVRSAVGQAGSAPETDEAIASIQMVAVGAVSDRRARLWLRTKAGGPFTVEVWAQGGEARAASVADRRAPDGDGTMAFTVPDDAPGIGQLAPATEHGFRVTDTLTSSLVGEGRFETAPLEGARDPLAFAFMSCHQPFKSDGSIHPDSARMLASFYSALERRGVKYVLLIGDQIYADAPAAGRALCAGHGRSLFEMSTDEIRRCYQAHYRRFWVLPEMRRLLARWPSWCIWDDHEIVNDWGTRRAHLRPEWRRVFEGARQAFVDYQASRAMVSGSSWPSAFDQWFVWGSAATFMLDLISQRRFARPQAQVYGDDQLKALAAFLHEQRARPVVFIVLTVPLVYLPDWVVALGELVPRHGALFATRWNAARNRRALDRLLDVLRAHQRNAPGQKLVLLSGDVHQGAAVALHWPEGGRAYQFVSSPVTNAERDWKELIARQLSFTMRRVRHGPDRVAVERLAGTRSGQANPFHGLNVGVVSVEEQGAGAAVRFELVTYDERVPGAARVAYDSGQL